jgi:Skp family chaperone for outer membrane proteins
MRGRTLLVPLLGALALSLLAPAWARAQSAIKVGVIDARRAVANSKEGKEAEKTLTSLMERKREGLRPQEDEYKRKKEELDTSRYVLSKEALAGKELELLKLENDLKRAMSAAQEEIEIEERKTMAPILTKIQQVVKNVGAEQGFSVILERSAPSMLFYDQKLDITDLVIQRLNETS